MTCRKRAVGAVVARVGFRIGVRLGARTRLRVESERCATLMKYRKRAVGAVMVRTRASARVGFRINVRVRFRATASACVGFKLYIRVRTRLRSGFGLVLALGLAEKKRASERALRKTAVGALMVRIGASAYIMIITRVIARIRVTATFGLGLGQIGSTAKVLARLRVATKRCSYEVTQVGSLMVRSGARATAYYD